MNKKKWMRTIGKVIEFDYFADIASVETELLKKGWVQAPDDIPEETGEQYEEHVPVEEPKRKTKTKK